MARPKLPLAQRKALVMTVRMRLDLSEGLAAAAFLRGTSKSGLVSQYAAEQIKCEQERDPLFFAAAVEGIRSRRRAQRSKKSARSRFERLSNSSDCLKLTIEQRQLDRLEGRESPAHDHSIGPHSDDGQTTTQVALGRPSLVARATKASGGAPKSVAGDATLDSERPE
jgi:hypothetical protein